MAMTLRPSEDETARLRALAAAQGRSMHDVVMAAVREYVAAHEADDDVATSIRETLPAYQELFERLGKV